MVAKGDPMSRVTKIRLGVLLALAALAAIAAGCGGGDGGGGGGGGITVGLSVNGAPLPFYETLRESAQKEAKAKGVNLRVVTPTTPEEQNRSVDNLLTQNVDVIGIAPIDAQGIVPSVQRANAKDVPVITADETAAGGKIYTYIASPNLNGGVLAGQWLAKELKGKGNIAIVQGGAGSSTNNARLDGFNSVLKKNPGIKVVASTPADWVTDKGFAVSRDMLTAHPNIDAFWAVNDAMALGVVQAVQQRGKKTIVIEGYNGDPDAFDAIRAHKMNATIAQNPTKMGQLFIQQAIAAKDGKPAASAKIDVPVKVVDQSNIGSVSAR